MRTLVAFLATCLTLPALADSYTIDPRHTFASFEINHLGFSTQRGRFNETEGKIVLDTAARTGSVDITINASSIDTGLDELEKHLMKNDFFNTADFPTLTFKSNALRFEEDKVVGVDGTLTLLGVTKPVSLTVTSFKCARHPVELHRHVCGGDAYATIKRSDFGMSKYVPALADEVKIAIQIEALRD